MFAGSTACTFTERLYERWEGVLTARDMSLWMVRVSFDFYSLLNHVGSE
jgi:hypothetical protein